MSSSLQFTEKQAFKSIEIIQGDGGAGSIRQISYTKGGQSSSVKKRIDELNKESYSYKYTLIEGDKLTDRLEFIAHEIQFEPTPGGGSKTKITTKYHTKGDIVVEEEEIRGDKEKVLATHTLVEDYLLRNPDVYA